jgi:DNA modification methylase
MDMVGPMTTDCCDNIFLDDALTVLPELPAASVDLVFADPPYNLQLRNDLWRPNHTYVEAVDEEWDQFDSFATYDEFTRIWLKEVRRIMKPTATIWVSGTYHNIFRVGTIMQNLGFWILNTVAWYKHNAMPNFRGMRLKNDVEFIIWAKYAEKSRYLFHHHYMKQYNDFTPDKQLGSVWQIKSCGGPERLRTADGIRLHPTQKPEDLLERIILASSRPGQTILDPFVGTGTSAVIAKRFRRHWIGIEKYEPYFRAAVERIATTRPLPANDPRIMDVYEERLPRVAFKKLVKAGYLRPGQTLYLEEPESEATILENGRLRIGTIQGSIHQLASLLRGIPSQNGWKFWQYVDESGKRHSIDQLRKRYRECQT